MTLPDVVLNAAQKDSLLRAVEGFLQGEAGMSRVTNPDAPVAVIILRLPAPIPAVLSDSMVQHGYDFLQAAGFDVNGRRQTVTREPIVENAPASTLN